MKNPNDGWYGASISSIESILLYQSFNFNVYLETEYRLFPPVTIFVNLFPRAGYFFNAFD